jgi:hypothetical protein
MQVREPIGRTFPIATVEVIRMPTLLEAFQVWWRYTRAWKLRERATDGRQIVGAQYTFRGDELHAPWGPKPRFFPEAMRPDAWGWFPDMRRVLILSAWESRDAHDSYEAKLHLPEGTERWVARLRPVKVKGKIEGEQVLGEFTELAGTGHKPGVSMTWNKHGLWHEPTWRAWVRKIVDATHKSPGALASMGTGWALGLPYFRAFTLTCWRRLDDSVKFAYRTPDHADVITWWGDPERFSEPWWGRFVVEQSRGTLAGKDPFEGVELDPEAPPPDDGRVATEPAATPAASPS